MVTNPRRWTASLLLCAALLSAGAGVLGALVENISLVCFVRALEGTEGLRLEVEDNEQFARAERWLNRASRASSVSNTTWLAIGFARAMTGDEAGAIHAWQRSGDAARALVVRGRVALEADSPEQAVEWFDRAARVEPDNWDPWYFLASYQRDAVGPEEALASLEEGVQRDFGRLVGRSDVYFRIAHVRQHYLRPPDLEGAWVAYDKALAVDDYRFPWLYDQTLYQRGSLLVRREDWAAAIREFKRALERNPRSVPVLEALGQAYVGAGNMLEAEDAYLRAIELAPGDKRAYRALGELYARMGDGASAAEMYRKVLELDPQDQEAQDALDSLDSPSSGVRAVVREPVAGGTDQEG